MFSELFNGEIIYSKRFPLPTIIEKSAEAADIKKDTTDKAAAREAFTEYMQRSDERCVYVMSPDRMKFCQQFIDYAKSFSEEFEIGIDIVNNKFSYTVMLYLDTAYFCGRYKEKIQHLMFAADEVYFDRPHNIECETRASFLFNTHDFYYDGERRIHF